MVHVVVGSTRKQDMVCCFSDGDDGSGCTDSACVHCVVQNRQDQEENFDLKTRRHPLLHFWSNALVPFFRDSVCLDPTCAEIKRGRDPVARISPIFYQSQ